ncbi:MAG TPA: hypothetical protein VGB18_05980 [Candidatus Thermoplasmatota archaeon]
MWVVAAAGAFSAFLDAAVAALYSLRVATVAFIIGGFIMFGLGFFLEKLKVSEVE